VRLGVRAGHGNHGGAGSRQVACRGEATAHGRGARAACHVRTWLATVHRNGSHGVQVRSVYHRRH
jgi:hypothetical protein